ncbi:hypothetical protein [Litorihabitans aurantiacus]|uniref:DUF1801 domain-containing protein n=1 Tax=Litorihabitans aurantiacus TaxID=1930061 RepID=A0AA37XGH4_9MICO|nr:hypothetical protein [Litorihabitans aurantiacus]GMA32526.1 hypothetical protein GCM10025875_25180 [Litorihabitans aurantiacus]
MTEASGFSEAERAAMKQRAAELKEGKGLKGAAKKAKELQACLDAIAGLEGFDRVLAERYHVVVTQEAPHLDPRTWYGFPSYAKDGTVVTFVQQASKFDSRYATVNFADVATLDDGAMWPTSFAVVEWTDEVEETLRALVRRAAAA